MVPAHSIKVSRVSMYSGFRHVVFPFAYGAFTLSGRLSQNLSARINESIMRSEPHGARTMVWPLSISLAATLEIDFFFLFLRLLRCFSSPGSLPYVMDWRMDDWSSSSRVSPFRYLRLNGYLLLPAAFRSLSRLSSALSAKASTLRPYQLDLIKNFVLVRCIALHLFFFACQLILQNYLAWMSDKSYLYDLFFYMQFSRYHMLDNF